MTNSEKPDLESLEEFKKEFDDEDSGLYLLEKSLNEFNVFDVLKNAQTEIKHSNVLAWLLDPKESHNTGNKALKLFLESIPSDVDLTSLINGSSKISVEVLREWEDIDISILIKSGSKRFLIIIENKTKTKDFDKQLEKYRNRVENKFKEDCKKIFVYLTPEGDEPNDKNELWYWNLLSYEQIVSNILNKVTLVAKGNVKKFIDQYVDMLRRNILKNTKVNNLCSEIYKNHNKAINFILKEVTVKKFIDLCVKDKIKKNDDFIFVKDTQKYTSFTTKKLDEKIKIQSTMKGRSPILQFQIVNTSNSLRLTLVIIRGNDRNQLLKQLLSFMKRHKEIFTSIKGEDDEKKLKKTKVAFSMTILCPTDYVLDDAVEENMLRLTEKIEKEWPTIEKKIKEIDGVFINEWSN